MLEVYYGNDTNKVRQTAFKRVEKLRADGVEIEHINPDNYQAGQLTDAIGGVSLFGSQSVYVIDTASDDESMYDEVVSRLEAMAESSNVFVVIETGLLAAEKKKFAKHAGAMEEFKAAAGARVNNFALADALARRDKRSLWLLWSEARLNGTRPEELIGILWWQLKTLRLSAQTRSATEAGLKDFPYQKAKRALSKFKPGELEKLSHSLLSLQHDSRLGLTDVDVAAERWILRI